MSVTYRHTQFGVLVVCVLGGGVPLLAILGFTTGWRPMNTSVLLVLVACLLLFHSLTVEIKNGDLEIRFGVGLVRKRFHLREIQKAYPVVNRWYFGWGIRLIPGGWLFNVSGMHAIEMVMSSGKRYRIGTDQPGELNRAIREAKALVR